MSAVSQRSHRGFLAGALIGTLGGLIGLGGAEFRLPVLVGVFRLATLEAVIINKALSLVVVITALGFRISSIPVARLAQHWDVPANLLAGSLVGAWWAAGHAMTLPRRVLDRIIMALLVGLALLMLSESWLGLHDSTTPLIAAGPLRVALGLVAGLGIGAVAALLGVAGGELLIPTIVLLFGLDIKLAGSLSLVVSLPTMVVGFARYRQAQAFDILRQERPLLVWMAAGSVLGAAIGGQLVGLISQQLLLTVLGVVLLTSAVKLFLHSQPV